MRNMFTYVNVNNVRYRTIYPLRYIFSKHFNNASNIISAIFQQPIQIKTVPIHYSVVYLKLRKKIHVICFTGSGFECTNKKCIDFKKTCDGNNDCGDFSDEVDRRCRAYHWCFVWYSFCSIDVAVLAIRVMFSLFDYCCILRCSCWLPLLLDHV